MAAWAVNADNLRASSVKTAIKNTGIKCVSKLLYTGRHFWNRKCRKKTWWQQEFAVFKCEATANSVTGHVCVNSNVNNPYSAFLTDKTVPLNASTSLTVPVYVTVTLSPSFTSESPSGF